MGRSTYGAASFDVMEDAVDFEEMAPRAMMQKSVATIGAGEGALNVPVKKGVLPTRIELPALGKTMTVRSHLVHSKDPLKLTVLVMHENFKYLLYLVSLVSGIICIKTYRWG